MKYFYVYIEITYLAGVEGGAEGQVHVLLLLGGLDAARLRDRDRRRDVDGRGLAARVQVQALPVAVHERLHQRLRDRLQDLALAGHVADGPLAQLGAANVGEREATEDFVQRGIFAKCLNLKSICKYLFLSCICICI